MAATQLWVSLAGGQARAVPILVGLPEMLRGPAAEGSIRELFKLPAGSRFHVGSHPFPPPQPLSSLFNRQHALRPP